MNWLDWYEILIWEKDGYIFISISNPEIAIRLSKEGYTLLGDASKLQGWASTVLDENENVVKIGEKL